MCWFQMLPIDTPQVTSGHLDQVHLVSNGNLLSQQDNIY